MQIERLQELFIEELGRVRGGARDTDATTLSVGEEGGPSTVSGGAEEGGGTTWPGGDDSGGKG